MNKEFQGNFDKPAPKYVLCPGFIFSKNDGDRHYISARKLAELYHVSMNECVVKPDMDDPRYKGWRPPEDAIELNPKYNGNYTLPHNQ
ncbi:MAG: hypothetical protein ACU836_15015 [Gammaproteobacteria bacterium]